MIFIPILLATICAIIKFDWISGIGLGCALYVLAPYQPQPFKVKDES